MLNLNYPSTKHNLQELAEIIHPQISEFAKRVGGKIHFVGYSMGGLLIRAYLKKFASINVGRIAMVGTPNHGSEVADFLKNWWLYKKLYGPSGQQLTTNQQDFAHILSDLSSYELGIIAGNKPIDFICSRIIGKPNDGKVSIESTKLESMQTHAIMPHSHTFFPVKRGMWREVSRFLRDGEFSV